MKKYTLVFIFITALIFSSCGKQKATYTSLNKALKNKDKATHLDLSSQQLKTFPKEILRLSKLESLNLKGNGIKDIPSGIIMLKKLSFIDLRENPISDIIINAPEQIKIVSFEGEILDKISDKKQKNFLLSLYREDNNTKNYQLKKNLTQEQKSLITKTLKSVGYTLKKLLKAQGKTAIYTTMDWLVWLTGKISGLAWGLPTIIILVGTGLYLTIRLKFIQGRGFKHAFQLLSGKYDKKDDPGEVSHFQALSTALSGTVGTGNIAGVASAIAIGGPGAVFWMWITALFGMATKYASCTLALKYREIHPDGKVSGGPMYTLLHGLNMPKIAFLFAFFTLIASFGIGNMVQVNSVVNGLKMAIPSLGNPGMEHYNYIIGAIIAVLVGLVIIGGVKRIAKLASLIVPFMAIVYCGAALVILAFFYNEIPGAFYTIFEYAFNPPAAVGGATGFAVQTAIQKGVSRGVFSNESGLGSAPMAHSAAKTDKPVREGLVAMIEPFIDTIVICTMTALVIVIVGAWGDGNPKGYESSDLSAYAFQIGFEKVLGTDLSFIGTWVVGFGLIFFAYTSIVVWSYYGDRCAEYLFGEKAVLPYRIVYTLLAAVGAIVPVKLVWNVSDIANIFMAFPNLISLLLLAGLVTKMTNDYLKNKI